MTTAVSETRRFGGAVQATASSTTLSRVREEITKATGLTASGIVTLAVAVLFWGLARFVAGRPMYLISYGLLVAPRISYLLRPRPLPLQGMRSHAPPPPPPGE